MCEPNSCGQQPHLPPIDLTHRQRRQFIKGLVSLPLATVLAYPELSRASAAQTMAVSLNTAGGNRVSAALAVPEVASAPAVVLIHEWWGLNDQIKSVAAELARLGYLALAVDLYADRVTRDPQEARQLMQSVDATAATDTLTGWVDYLRQHPRGNGRVGTLGWCFGGGWSLNASLATAVDATVIYYGNVARDAASLAALKGPVLGHFATEDQWINRAMVNGFETAMHAAGKSNAVTIHWYTANHAFANPSSARYDAQDAATAWQRTRDFFRQHLE